VHDLVASILVVDDDPAIRKIVADRFKALGHTVDTAADGAAALAKIETQPPDLVILDWKMPVLDGFSVLERLAAMAERPEAVMMTAHGSIESAIRAVRAGAADFIVKPFDAAHLEHIVRKVLHTAGLKRRVRTLETELSARHSLVLGQSRAMQAAVDVAEKAAASEATILVLGESGSGKEVITRFIHQRSKRAAGPFVAVNCAVLSATLLESELFGHDKGAFTGAQAAKPGQFELAAGGTLLLDEIGEMDPGIQAKLLRVLQEREFQRVGGTRTIKADVRVIAATHRDLAQAVQDGRFRQDLYYRLKVITVQVPPLRDRAEDIVALAQHLADRFCRDSGRAPLPMADDAVAAVQRYGWPGNVRELANAMERAVVFAPGPQIRLEDLPEELREQAPSAERVVGSAPTDASLAKAAPLAFHDAVRLAKVAIIEDALRATDGHQTRAAERLGLTQPYLSRLMKNLGISRQQGQ
jgi:DNA-binding NtrC family response regulator